MKAFILAAGVSRRLYPHTYDIPKCLLKVSGKPIIHYQLEALEELGVHDITMVVGYHREMLMMNVKKYFPRLNFNFVVNNHYFETNTAYSVHVASESLESLTLLMNADVIYPKELLKKLYSSDYGTVLAVGEFIGVAKLSIDFIDLFTKSISVLIEAGGKNDYFEAGIQPLLEKIDVHYIDISEYPCLEIDFIEDLESARELFKDKR